MMTEKLVAESLQDKAYKLIKTAILKNELKPGERLIDTQLASKLGVSRTPIRDVFKMLEKEGLIMSNGSKGYFVAKLLKEEINEIFDIRILVETYALKISNNEDIANKLKKFKILLDEVIESEDFIGDMVDLDIKFHESIVKTCGNQLLINFYNNISTKMRIFWQYTYYKNSECENREKVLNLVQQSNQEIINALESNDMNLVIELIKKHINSSRETALRYFDDVY
jgi:DNA-binding GntR family transcriptional regulator